MEPPLSWDVGTPAGALEHWSTGAGQEQGGTRKGKNEEKEGEEEDGDEGAQEGTSRATTFFSSSSMNLKRATNNPTHCCTPLSDHSSKTTLLRSNRGPVPPAFWR